MAHLVFFAVSIAAKPPGPQNHLRNAVRQIDGSGASRIRDRLSDLSQLLAGGRLTRETTTDSRIAQKSSSNSDVFSSKALDRSGFDPESKSKHNSLLRDANAPLLPIKPHKLHNGADPNPFPPGDGFIEDRASQKQIPSDPKSRRLPPGNLLQQAFRQIASNLSPADLKAGKPHPQQLIEAAHRGKLPILDRLKDPQTVDARAPVTNPNAEEISKPLRKETPPQLPLGFRKQHPQAASDATGNLREPSNGVQTSQSKPPAGLLDFLRKPFNGQQTPESQSTSDAAHNLRTSSNDLQTDQSQQLSRPVDILRKPSKDLQALTSQKRPAPADGAGSLQYQNPLEPLHRIFKGDQNLHLDAPDGNSAFRWFPGLVPAATRPPDRCYQPHAVSRGVGCVCEDGYTSDNPTEHGCWKCSETCHAYGTCQSSGHCVCQRGYAGDGVKDCRPVIPVLIRLEPSVCPASGCVLNATFGRTDAMEDDGFCRFGAWVVRADFVSAGVMQCQVPPLDRRKTAVAISFDSLHFSKNPVDLVCDEFLDVMWHRLAMLGGGCMAVAVCGWVVSRRKGKKFAEKNNDHESLLQIGGVLAHKL
jgi:hypothetical protein